MNVLSDRVEENTPWPFFIYNTQLLKIKQPFRQAVLGRAALLIGLFFSRFLACFNFFLNAINSRDRTVR